KIPKTYMVKIEGNLTKNELRELSGGIRLPDGNFKPENLQIKRTNRKSSWLALNIAEGRNRLIRRGLESLGHPVIRLIRTAIADISLGNMKAGTFRYLTKKEVEHLLSF
ncbi:MAG: pseudouridine synthase, partial [Syntrophales bacterium]